MPLGEFVGEQPPTVRTDDLAKESEMAMKGWVGRTMAVVLVSAFALTVVSRAQNENASISGYVFDPQMKAVPGADVTATEPDKNQSYTAQTDPDGHYTILQVPPGSYVLTVAAANFKTYRQEAVALHANDKLALPDITLTVGTVNETVTVTTEVATLKTESAELSDTLENKQMENLAVNGRSPLSLATLTPGVSSQVSVETGGTGGISEFAANGVRNNSNNMTINGIGDIDTGLNGVQNVTVSLDSVQEFKLLTGVYQAQYGRSSGAQVNLVTKSGTSDFHGSAYFYHRNEGMNANDFIDSNLGNRKPIFRYNDPGYTIGGPIYIPGHLNTHKDKLFFFWSEEFQRQLIAAGAPDQVWIPTAAEVSGDFSGDANPFIKNPLSTLPCTPAATSASPGGCFDGLKNGVPTLGVIPSSQLYGPGVAYLKLLNHLDPSAPAVLENGVGNFNYSSQIASLSPRREDLLRIDYNATAKLRISGTYIHNSNTSTGPYGGLDPNETAPLAILATNTPGYQWGVGGEYVFNATTVDDFEVGVSNNSLHNSAPASLTRTGTGVDLPVLFPTAITDDFVPNLSYGSNAGSGAGVAVNTGYAPFLNFNTDIDVTDNLSHVWNQHTFKAGVYLQRSRKNQTAFGNANGNYSFASDPTNPFDTGNGLANLAVGIADEFDQASGFFTGDYRYTNIEGYFQDTWKIAPRLTLDLGLRISWYQPQYDQLDQISNFVPNQFAAAQEVALYQPALVGGVRVAQNPQDPAQTLPAADIGAIVPGSGNLLNGIELANHSGASSYLVDNRFPQLGPRIGIAWDVTGRQNLVVRTGFGIYYDRIQGNRVFGLLSNPPTSVDPTIHYACINTPANCPDGAAAVSSASALAFPSTLAASDVRAKIPTVYETSFGVESKLPWQMILDASYVGTFSSQLTDETNLNGIPYGTTFQASAQDPSISVTSGGVLQNSQTGAPCLAAGNPGGYSGACALPENLLRPFPGYGDIWQYTSTGTANYNALQVGVTRRYARGLFLGIAYTYSKAMTTTPNTGIVGSDFFPTRIDGLTKQVDYAYSPFDMKHNFVANYVYDFPSIFHSGWKHTMVDGWQFSGISRFSTGSPYHITYGEFTPSFAPDGGDASIFITTPIYFFGVPEQLTGSYTEVAHVALTGAPIYGSGGSQHMLNPAAFALPTAPSRGLESPRSSAYAFTPGWNNWDMSLQKNFVFAERYALQLRCDAFNAFNHTQISGVNSTALFLPFGPQGVLFNTPTAGTFSDSAFGTVSAVRDPRRLQLVARFTF